MSDSLFLNVKLEEEHYFSFAKQAKTRFLKNLSTSIKIFRYLSFFVIWSAIFLYSIQGSKMSFALVSKVIFILLITLISLQIYIRVIYRNKSYMPNKDSEFWGQKTYIIDKSGVQVISSSANSESNWSNFTAVEQDDHCIYLMLQNNYAFILPKSQLENHELVFNQICNFIGQANNKGEWINIDFAIKNSPNSTPLTAKEYNEPVIVNYKRAFANTFKATIRSCLFLRANYKNIHISNDAFTGLALLMAAVLVITPIYNSLPKPSFSYYAFEGHLIFYLLTIFIAFTYYNILRRFNPEDIKHIDPKFIILVFFSIFILTQFIDAFFKIHMDYESEWHSFRYWLFLCWPSVIIAVIFLRLSKKKVLPILASIFLFITYYIIPSYYFTGGLWSSWYVEEKEQKTASSSNNSHTNETYWDEAKKVINQEKIYYNQFDLLAVNKDYLEAGTEGVTDLYYLGFDSYATQDVFYKEGQYVQNLFDDKFRTKGRSIRLSNNLKSINNVPMANSQNLKYSLQQIGNAMNTEEDIAFLFLTTHGSKKHKLSVNMWPLKLNSIDPNDIKQYLDDSKIKWRIIVVSACYSGGFIEPLKDEYTLIATAAAADKTSFGCSHKNEFTHYGRVLFRDLLSQSNSFIDSFKKAQDVIYEDEIEEDRKHSYPQLHIGEKMKVKLEEFQKKNTVAINKPLNDNL